MGGERTAAWAKHLNESGIYPIVITRVWNENQKDLVDPLDRNEMLIEKTDKYEIRRLPYKRTLRDKLSKYRSLRVLQKALTLKELIFSNYFVKSLPYHNFYSHARDLIQSDDIKAVIASGRPFQSFFIGHKLKKEFDILWVPDYRDEWSTHKHVEQQVGISKWISKLECKSELKWTSNADTFLTVSDNWRKSIGNLIGKNGEVVLNGFSDFVEKRVDETMNNQFVLTYAGTLYSSQNISVIIKSCLKLIDSGESIFVRFIGANMMPKELGRIMSLIKGYESHFEFLDRMPKEELNKYLNQSDLLFLTAFHDIKGWYPVKLFEYYASGVPILLCPTDDDQMRDFVKRTNSGFVANSENECLEVLSSCLKQKKQSGVVATERNIAHGVRYSRQYQAAILGEVIRESLFLLKNRDRGEI